MVIIGNKMEQMWGIILSVLLVYLASFSICCLFASMLALNPRYIKIVIMYAPVVMFVLAYFWWKKTHFVTKCDKHNGIRDMINELNQCE